MTHAHVAYPTFILVIGLEFYIPLLWYDQQLMVANAS